MSLTLGAALGLGAGSAAVNLGGSFLGALFNKGAAEAALEKQVAASKELLDYQMEKYQSPLAQMKQIGKAGLNPAAMFGNTAPVNVGGQMTLPNAPMYGIDVGTQSLSDVASLLVGAAQAKKAGADTKVSENAAEGAALDNERKRMENDFMQRFGLQKSAMELAQAYANLENTFSDTNLKAVQQAKEKAMSECNEKQRDLLQKELDNKDTEIRLRNEKAQEEINTQKSVQSANYASAENSKASATNYRQQARINSVLADISEATSTQEIQTKISNLVKEQSLSETDAEQARQKLQSITNMRDGGSREKIDDLLIWLKDRINPFK